MRKGFYRFCLRMVWGPVKVLWRPETRGVPRVTDREGGLLIAANHQSFLDPMLIGVAWREPISYLARRSLFRIPGLGALMGALDAHPISRGAVDAAGVRTALRLLRGGRTVLVFPEGTRTHDGSLGRFRPGAAALAVRCGVPMVPACVAGAYRCWPRTRALPRSGRTTVAFGRAIVPKPGEQPDELNRRLRNAIQQLQGSMKADISICRGSNRE